MTQCYAGKLMGEGRYKLLKFLDSGGMAEVWLAVDVYGPVPDGGPGATLVAVKFMHEQMFRDSILPSERTDPRIAKQFMERFEREMKVCGQFNHPNIIRTLYAGTDEYGVPYYVMDFVKGRTFGDEIDERNAHAGLPPPGESDESGKIPTKQLAEPAFNLLRLYPIMDQIMAAVEYLHGLPEPVIHRDLKPQNMIIQENQHGQPHVVLLDFGIAKIMETAREYVAQRSKLTLDQQIIGTPDYMPVELYCGVVEDKSTGKMWGVGPHTDVYAIGVMLFEAYTGRLPYGGLSVTARQFKVIDFATEPPDPAQYVPGMNPKIRDVILKALAKRPWNRFQTVEEMRAAFRAAEAVDRTRLGIGTVRQVTHIPAALTTRPASAVPSMAYQQTVVGDSSPPTSSAVPAVLRNPYVGAQAQVAIASVPVPREGPAPAKEPRPKWALAWIIGVIIAGVSLGVLLSRDPNAPSVTPSAPPPDKVLISAEPVPPPSVKKETRLYEPPKTVQPERPSDSASPGLHLPPGMQPRSKLYEPPKAR